MKYFITLVMILGIYSFALGQDYSELADYKFKSHADYQAAQDQVVECANYLFSNPATKDEINRQYCIQYIVGWMEGTSDYTFQIGEKALELTNSDSDLFGLYMAALSKVALENPDLNGNNEELYNKAEAILVEYTSDPANNLKPSKKMKKIIKKNKS